MQENTSKAYAQALGPQIKAIKAKEGLDSAGEIPLNFLCGMLMKDYMGRSNRFRTRQTLRQVSAKENLIQSS